MDRKTSNQNSFNVDVKNLSHINLVELIEQLKESNHTNLLEEAKKELVERLKKKDFSNQKIATILITNVYGVLKKKKIASEWANALGISKEEFLKFIGMR